MAIPLEAETKLVNQEQEKQYQRSEIWNHPEGGEGGITG
ncbi:hypothetical protein COLO4_35471 [Corchorus olitorius]|uniref:Uncharacterized protein n=1 Tax=Corchorus olitorius TaxID=93759 RepID=A0A1R3GGJ7_9ROSI|nr:hypothetical protein COLO4_35471 [Corchorus olitorius]